MHLIVVGDIHAQFDKFWLILQQAGLADVHRHPSETLQDPEGPQLVLLGDLVHAKSRARYSEICDVHLYDEHNPEHIRKAEAAQEAFLREVLAFQESLPAGRMEILLGNHDHNVIDAEQGSLRTDDVSHLEWKEPNGAPFPSDLRRWLSRWPRELIIAGVHLAHVGPKREHNTYDNDFYLENRRRWIYEEGDALAKTPYSLGVYGHTPVRGGVSMTSRGRVILLDTNGHGDEFVYLEVRDHPDGYRLRMRGLFFDEIVPRSLSEVDDSEQTPSSSASN
jgi:hypothetical protein